MNSPRRRLVSLCLSQSARALADGCLAGALLAHRAGTSSPVAGAALGLALVLGPCAGVGADRAGKRPVLIAGCLAGLAATLYWLLLPGLWPAALGLLAVGAALSGAAGLALLPAAARDARLPLARVLSAVAACTAAAAAGGLLLGRSPGDAPLVLAVAALGNLLALAAALPARFPSDAAGPPVRIRFLGEGLRLLREVDTRDPLLALAGLAALAVLGGGVAFGRVPDAGELPALLSWAGLGAAAGALLAPLQPHPCRVLCVVPAAVTGLAAVLLWSAHTGAIGPWPGFLVGLTAGLAAVPLGTAYLAFLPPGARGYGVAWMVLPAAAAARLTFGLLPGLDRLPPAGRFGLLAAVAAAAVAAAWWAFFREFAETVAELLLVPFYRLRVHGPGVARFPMRGPLLVLANHHAWFDPLWLCKALPRRTTPLMISIYFDRPVLHWLMSRVIRAIRVQDTPYRREAPELEQAVAALDQGGCVMIFPEGVVRRKEEVPLRHFGQGVWRILRERPDTPVVVCWIEGGWRSFTSFYQGPPMTNKPLDWRRPIDIVLEEPQVLAPALLDEQRATRHYLEQACLDARRHLGLEEPAEQPVVSGS